MHMNKVFISKLATFLPNSPISNDNIEDVLGLIGGQVSRIKNIILNQNKIKKRYYAIQDGSFTHTNAELMVNAIKGLFDSNFSSQDIELLSCGTSTPDQMMPSHTSMVHGLLPESKSIPILSPAGVCCSGIHALEYCYLSVLSGRTKNAVCGASELFSPLLLSDKFEAEYEKMLQLQLNPYIAFEKDFLRWMLSDGAGCALLTNTPSSKINFQIEWIESVSYANELPVCMSQGLEVKNKNIVRSWKVLPVDNWKELSIFSIRQDVKLLSRFIADKAVQHIYNSCQKHHFHFNEVDFFLPHLSSMFFFDVLREKLNDFGLCLDIKKWFTNLPDVGNVGAASIFLMLDELYRNFDLHDGQQIFIIVPESSRFSYTTALLKVVINN